MDNQHADEIDALLSRLSAGRTRIIQQCAGKALAFFKKSFRDEGFTDRSLVKWKKRTGGPRNAGRATGTLKGVTRRAIRIARADSRGALITVDPAVKYAQIQNEGGTIPITPKMRRYFWAMYYKAGGGVKGMSPDDIPELAKFWIALALTSEDHITIPKRQFIGDSKVLSDNLETYILREITKLFESE